MKKGTGTVFHELVGDLVPPLVKAATKNIPTAVLHLRLLFCASRAVSLLRGICYDGPERMLWVVYIPF